MPTSSAFIDVIVAKYMENIKASVLLLKLSRLFCTCLMTGFIVGI
jgi:hypothetical protein